MMCFNVDFDEESMMNRFKNSLLDVKKLMEADDVECGAFYLNIFYTTDEHDQIDLSKVATLSINRDGLVIYSLKTWSTMFIPYQHIRLFEIVELKS